MPAMSIAKATPTTTPVLIPEAGGDVGAGVGVVGSTRRSF